MKSMSIENFAESIDLSTITTYQVGMLQASSHRMMQKHSEEVLKQYGINKMHWIIIGTVLETGDEGIRLSDLATRMGTTISYITTAVNLLSSRDILIREQNDADSRSKIITINESYKPVCKEIETTLRDALRESMYAKIARKDLETYIKVLAQFVSLGDK